MPFLSEVSPSGRMGACITIQGPPKSGKTTSLGGLVLALKTLDFIKTVMLESLEGGHVALSPSVLEQMAVWIPPPSTFTVQEKAGQQYITQHFPDAVDYSKEFSRTWIQSNFLVNAMDTASTLAYQLLDTVTRKDLASGGKRQEFLSKGGLSVRTPAQQDYGNAQAHLKALFYEMHTFALSSNRLMVILAHEKELGIESEDGILRNAQVGPQFVGRDLTREFPKVPHVIARTCTEKGRSIIMTRSESGLYNIGDRLDVLPGKIDVTGATHDERYENWSRNFWLPILTSLNWDKKETA